MSLQNKSQISNNFKPCLKSYSNKLLRCLTIRMRKETEINKILSFIYDENDELLDSLRKRFKIIYLRDLDQDLKLGSDTSNSVIFNNRFDLKEQAIFLIIILSKERKGLINPYQYWYEFNKFFQNFTLHFISTKLEYFLENRRKYTKEIDEILRNMFDHHHPLFFGFIKELYQENPKNINFYGFNTLGEFLKQNNNSVGFYNFNNNCEIKERALYFLMMIGTRNDYWKGKNFYDFFWRYTMLHYSKSLEEAIIDINPFSLPSTKTEQITQILTHIFSTRKYCHFMSNFVNMKTLVLYDTHIKRKKKSCNPKILRDLIIRIKQNNAEDNSLKKLIFFLIQRGNSKEWKDRMISDLYPNF